MFHLFNANSIEFRKRLRFIKALVYQMPLVQLVIIVLTALLVEAQVIQRGSVRVIFPNLIYLNILWPEKYSLCSWNVRIQNWNLKIRSDLIYREKSTRCTYFWTSWISWASL